MHNFDIEQERMGKRWKLRRIRTAQEKFVLKTNREHDRIRDEIRNLGYIQLEQPIPAGYKRLFMLTEETKRLNNCDFYQNILKKINTIRYSPTKQFATERTSKRWRRRKRKKKEQSLQELKDWKHVLDKFTEEELNLFYQIKYFCTSPNCKGHIKYVFSEPWRFVLRIRPHFITEVKRKDSILEQREAELSDFLNQYKNQALLNKTIWCRKNSWKKFQKEYCIKPKYKDYTIKDKPLHEIEEEYHNEKKLWEYDLKN